MSNNKEDVKPDMLLGDVVERAAEIIGADKVAKAVERVTKKPCNCGQRKLRLNQWHAKQREKHRQRMAARAARLSRQKS